MKSPAQQPSSLLEALEPRLAPAGIVTVSVSGGVLTLTGDGLDNNIKVSSPSANLWQLDDSNAGQEGNVDTKFVLAGRPLDTATTQLQLPTFAGIKVVLNGGNDKVDLVNLLTNGAVSLQGGEGDDDMFISGTYNGPVTFDGGNGNDDVGVAGGIINNTVTVKTGAGNDTVFFGSGNYTKGITADLGTGNNEFTMLTDYSLNVFGNVSVTAAGGASNEQNIYLGIKSGAITGNLSIKCTAGTAYYFLGRNASDTLSINGNFNITGSSGNDSLLLAGRVSVNGGLVAKLGAGNNGIYNGIDTANNDATRLVMLGLGSLSYTGGAGNDSIYLEGPEVVIGGNVTATMGAGTNAMGFFNSDGTFIGGSLTYAGGAANDRVDFATENLTVGGKLTIKTAGSLDADKVFITPTYAVLHSVELTGGAKGSDIFYIGAPDETSSILISILGDIKTNTGAGFSDVRLTDVIVHGKVSHTSAVALVANVDDNDTFVIEESYVQGTVAINATGTAPGSIFINDTLCYSNVTIATGAGNDFVGFDTNTAGSIRFSAFYGTVTISLGAGDDAWFAGSNQIVDTVGNDFKQAVKVDGGAGNNHSYYGRNSSWNNSFLIDPVFMGVMAYDLAP